MKNYLTVLLLLLSSILLAQQVISGKVTDSYNEPLPGVNILIKGTTKGSTTDFEGNYTIRVKKGDTLIFTYIGFETKTVLVESQSHLNISLTESSSQLTEVIVTSLGIEKEKKALGYAATELKAKDLDIVKTINPLNALSGKISGVQIRGSSNGVASSSRIIIRGENSLNINNNSPLFILDGTPVNNRIFGVGGNTTDQADLPTDYGNGIAELNPDDFESLTVLKGAAASALYGSRAANGVVVISTKKGKVYGKGLGIEINSSTLFNTPLRLPDLQSQYGAGSSLEYATNSGTNFGPKLDGSLVLQETAIGEFVNRPFINRYNLNDFFRAGTSLINSVAISSANDKGHFYFSYGNAANQGIVPNTNLNNNSFRLNAGYQLTDKWQVNANTNYIIRGSDNLTVSGYGSQGIMYNLLWNSINVNLNELKNYWKVENREQRRLFSWGDNPWFIANENINAFAKNRFIGNISSSYKINEHFDLLLRAGVDQSDDFRWSRRSMGAHRFPNGMYREQRIGFTEVNTDFLLSYNKEFENLKTKVSVGANRFNQRITESILQGNGLTIPGLYNTQNIAIRPSTENNLYEKRINSVYAFANISYKNYLYLDFSARNDWSSALPKNNNSYFYPAASISFIPSSTLALPSFVDFLKLRFNLAQVGSDTDPYNLKKSYGFGTLPGSVTNNSNLPNEDLKPEITTSTEIGFESYLFNKIVFLDFSYYNSISRDQILRVGISGANGYSSVVRNAGEIQNSGIEAALVVNPISNDKFNWDISANFSKNYSRVNSLLDGLKTFIIAEGPNGVTVEARPGEQMGDIYGNYWERSPDGSVIYKDGVPITSVGRKKIGNYNPDWTLGLSTKLSYKRFNFSALFDIRKGGTVYSYTNAIGQESGILAISLPGREKGILGEGVVDNGDGSYSPNQVVTDAETWYFEGAYPRRNAEVNSFMATYIKLRELSFGLNLASETFSKLGIQDFSLNLVGSNLFLWTQVPNIDPEAQAISGGTLLPGIEVVQLPSTKSFGLKLNMKF
ncbi:MAG: SusC/RagA family TonB-linked outer membrane protein [Tenacibaculum sp.]